MSPFSGWVGLFPTYNLCDNRSKAYEIAKIAKPLISVVNGGYIYKAMDQATKEIKGA